MFWMKPKVTQRKTGTPGVIMIMIDRSASISTRACDQIGVELDFIKSRFPRAGAYGFHHSVMAISHTVHGCHPCTGQPKYDTWDEMLAAPCSLDISNALEYSGLHNPCKTILFSDGGSINKRRALQFADTISGNIDVFYCELSKLDFPEGHIPDYKSCLRDADKGFMQELARRGGGEFHIYNPDRNTLRQDINRILVQTRVHHHRLPPKHIHHGRVR